MKRNDIFIMRQDKRRGVVIMDKINIGKKRSDFTINETVSETKRRPYKINKRRSSTYRKKN